MLSKLMGKTLESYKRLSGDEEGAALVEYGMLIGLIAVVVGVAVALVGTNLSTGFNDLALDIPNWFNP